MKQKKFIITTDKKAADELMSKGFILVSYSGDTFTFMNSNQGLFSQDTKKNIHYTDSLCV